MKGRVAIIGPCVKMGGIERASAVIANEMDAQGYEVLYLAIFRHTRFFTLNPTIEYDEPLDGTNINKLAMLKTIFRIRKKIKAFNPDTILAYHKFYASLVLIALAGTHRKIYISERSSPFFKWPIKVAFVNHLALVLNRPTGIVAQTAIAATYQRKIYGKKIPIRVIPNALRQVILYPEIRRKKWILAVGRLGDPLKGFDRLIKAFSKIHAYDWRLVFAGGDQDGEELKILARELGVLERISFLGKVIDLDRIYAEAGIFVIPSRSEGFPNALCEALAAGLPCVAFDFIAGARDIITPDYNGLVVKDDDIQALAEAIQSLMRDDEKRQFIANNGLAIRERLDRSRIGEELCEFIFS